MKGLWKWFKESAILIVPLAAIALAIAILVNSCWT